MKTELKILHLENRITDAELVEKILKKGNNQFEKMIVENIKDFKNAIKNFSPDIVITSQTIPSLDSFEVIKILKKEKIKIPLLLLLDTISEEYFEEIMKEGADGYIFKERLHYLPYVILDVMEKKRLEQKLQESETFNKNILSAINTHIGVIDFKGNLIATNEAWDNFANKKEITSLHSISIGGNYFETCKQAIEIGDSNAVEVYNGIQSVIKKEKLSFEMEYPCHSKDQQRWFALSVKKFGININKVVISLHDITKRKIAENKHLDTSVELQKTLSELSKILDSSLDVICSINTEGEFVYVSPVSQQIWGYTPAELIGSKFIKIVYNEDIDFTIKTAKKIYQGLTIPLFENRYVHKSGRLVSLLWSVNWDEKRQLVFCIAKDITDQKRMEESIKSERDQFYDMFLKAPSAIGMLKGSEHVFEMANPLYLQLTGKKNIIGKTVAEVLPEVVEQGFISILDHVYKTGESYTGSEMLVKVDTKENGEMTDFYINFVYQAYRNIKGEIEGVFFFINDITEQIISRKEIEKSEKQYRQIVETTQEGIWQLDMHNKIIFVNKKICEILEYSEEEIIGKEHLYFMDEHEKEKAITAFERRKSGISENFLINFISKNGKQVLTNISATPIIDDQSNFKGSLGMISDITEMKKADEENKFKANLLNTIGQAAIATDINGIVNYWNKAAENIYGWTKEEAIGKHIVDIATTENTKEQAMQIMEKLKIGKTWSGEFKMKKKNGINFPALVTNSPIYNENNILTGIIGISSDISEIKKLEKLLEKTNRLAAIGSWEIDVLKGTVFWSDITKEIREVDKDYVPKLDVGISYFKEGIHKETIGKKVKDCIEHGTPWDEELQIITFKGNYKWVRTIGEGEFLNGKCIRIHGSFQDITNRKNVAEELRISQSNLQAIIENTDAAIFSLDTELRYIAFNKSLQNLIKQTYGIELKIGDYATTFLEKLETEEAKFWNDIYKKAFTGETVKFEKEHTSESSYSCSSFTIYPIWTNKTIIGLSCFIHDITAQKEEQNQKEKMIYDIVQRNSDLEQFSYIVSHNLRSPTANIIGFADILQDETLTPHEQKELLQGLSASVLGLDTIIKDINTILQSKREVHKKKEVIIFSKLVEDILVSIGNLIDKNLTHIITDFSDVDKIFSLKVYIYSIFYNLISNSIKYSKPNEQQLIEITSKKENGKIILIFKDNGLGIDMKTKGDKIFGLYNRFHSHVEGKGMGLFMVKTQIESLGGKVSIESELNKGTKFTIVFDN